MSEKGIALATQWVRGTVYPTGALLADLRFCLPSGRWVAPLAEPPWKPLGSSFPGHMARLGGEFFCLPFGGGGAVTNPASGWEGLADGPFDTPLHGPCANDLWRVTRIADGKIVLEIDLDKPYSVSKVEREIVFSPDNARVDTRVRITARRDACVPAAFHPIFRLPRVAGALQIGSQFTTGFTYPAIIAPDQMVAEPAHEFAGLDHVPKRRGGFVDASRLPFPERTEDVLLMAGVHKPIDVRFSDEGFAVALDWSRDHLPHCMMWIHDRGLDDPPWDGQYRGLGLEPMASAFDGPWALSAGANPLTEWGHATAIAVSPVAPVELHLSLTARELG